MMGQMQKLAAVYTFGSRFISRLNNSDLGDQSTARAVSLCLSLTFSRFSPSPLLPVSNTPVFLPYSSCLGNTFQDSLP